MYNWDAVKNKYPKEKDCFSARSDLLVARRVHRDHESSADGINIVNGETVLRKKLRPTKPYVRRKRANFTGIPGFGGAGPSYRYKRLRNFCVFRGSTAT
ncbi:hypothetical protein GN958_ATG10118 [Phytophthora infestans]|uniref:Uncharacterized protein n=1 Tax=Phytophthora infestans TaxID=4787 RepID=A0A8S9UIV8_PHYIN|nr:hypothetical protein GN958_ATG10118 [Phytophthora infestans]